MALRKMVENFLMFLWNSKRLEQKAFETLKYAFTIAPILLYFNPDLKICVRINILDNVIAVILSQKHLDKIFWFMAFIAKKMSPAKCNYKIYNKKLLAIICTFQ